MAKRKYKVIFNYQAPTLRWADIEVELPDDAPTGSDPFDLLDEDQIEKIHRSVVDDQYEMEIEEPGETCYPITHISMRDLESGESFSYEF